MSENFKLIDINNAIDQCLSKGVVGNEPILNLIDNGKFIPKEGWLWDYKETINLEAEGIAKTVLQVASFFNSYGGYIIYGVKEVVKDLIFEPQSVDFSNFNLAQLRDNIKKYTGNIIDITFKEVQVCLAEKNYNMGVLYIPKRETRSKPIPFIKNGPMKNNKPLFNINDTYLRILDECRKANTPDDWQLLFSERNFFSINNIESSKLADKRYFEHNLPSKSLICNDFIGREDLLTELWEWLNDEFEFVKILSGDGGKGKTSIAYKFCRTFLENPPIEYERILWLSVKEKQFSGINNSYYEIQDADFSDSLSFLICLADHSALDVKVYEDVSEKVIKKDLKENLPLFPSVVVVDDIDSLEDDEQKKIVDICRQLGSINVRFLITTRKKLAYSSDLCIDVPGLHFGEFDEYINKMCQKLNLSSLSSKALRNLHDKCDGSPLLSASILRLYKQGIDFNSALKEWSGQAGEDARNAALKREIDSLSSNAKRILLIIYYFKSCSFTELKKIAGIERIKLVDYLEELQSLFLVDEPRIINAEQRFSISNTTALLVGSNENELAHDYKKIQELVKKSKSDIGDKKTGNRYKIGLAIRQCIALLDDNRVNDAIATVDKELSNFPSNPDLLLMKARCLLNDENPNYEKVRGILKNSIAKGQQKEIAFELWYESEQKLESANGIIEVSNAALQVGDINHRNWYKRLARGYLLRAKYRGGHAQIKDYQDASLNLVKLLRVVSISEKDSIVNQLYMIHDQIWMHLEKDNNYGWLNVFDNIYDLIRSGDKRTVMYQRCFRCLIETKHEHNNSEKKEVSYNIRKDKLLEILDKRSSKDKLDRPFDDLINSI